METLRSTLLAVALVHILVTCSLGAEKAALGVTDLEVRGEVSPITAQTFSEQLRTELVNSRRFTVVDRQNMNKILEEQKLQMAGCTDFTNTDCAVQFGRLLAVQKMLVGSLTKIEERYIIDVKIVDVEKGVVEVAVSPSWTGSEGELVTFAKDVTSEILSGMPVVGRVTLVEGDSAYANIGSEDGIKVGDELEVVRRIEKKNRKGDIVMVKEQTVAKLVIIKVTQTACKGIIKGKTIQVAIDDLAKTFVDTEKIARERLQDQDKDRKEKERLRKIEERRKKGEEIEKFLRTGNGAGFWNVWYVGIDKSLSSERSEVNWSNIYKEGGDWYDDECIYQIKSFNPSFSLGCDFALSPWLLGLVYTYQPVKVDSMDTTKTTNKALTISTHYVGLSAKLRIMPKSRISPLLQGGIGIPWGMPMATDAEGGPFPLGFTLGGGIDFLYSRHLYLSLLGENYIVSNGGSNGKILSTGNVRVGLSIGLIP